MACGEAFTTGIRDKLFPNINDCTIVANIYGPTEATVFASAYTLTGTEDVIPIGRPLSNYSCFILDNLNHICPINVPGELFIGGAGLARGYLNNAELTAEKFVANPYVPGERMYRTGDLARWLPDGNIEFLGRIDNQVKIRGFRIELGEIESALSSCEGIKEAVVVARSDAEGLKYLCCFYTGEEDIGYEEFKEYLGRSLPEYMIPSYFHRLESMPLTSSGKLDRKSLPSIEGEVRSGKEYEAPRNETEEKLVRIWQEVLGVERIGINDNFFELGGHSLKAIRLVEKIKTELKVHYELPDLFKGPEIRQISAKLNETKKVAIELPEVMICPLERYEPFDLTDVQQAYWIGRKGMHELGNIGTHIYFEFEIADLDPGRYEYALNYMIDRHDMLRMVVDSSGKQRVLENPGKYRISMVDLSKSNEEDRHRVLADIRNEMSHQIFGGESWPLFDIRISVLPDNVYRVHYSMDALIMDGGSSGVLFKEWDTVYRGDEGSLSDLELTFRDYVMTCKEIEKGELYTRARDYWHERIPELPEKPELPLAMDPKAISAPRFERHSHRIAPSKWKGLKKAIEKIGVTPTIFFLEVFGTVVEKWSKTDHFLLNLTLFNRLPMHKDVERIIGDFTSLTLIEMDYRQRSSFTARMKTRQELLWSDLENRYFSAVEVQREMTRQRGETITVPVVFTSAIGLSGDDKILEEDTDESKSNGYGISQTSQVWLDFQLYDDRGGVGFNWDSVEGLFPDGMLDEMFGSFIGLIDQLAIQTESWDKKEFNAEMPLRQREIREDANRTEKPETRELLHNLFIQRVKENGKRRAVEWAQGGLSYEELYGICCVIESCLLEYGVEPNELVGVVMNKGWEQIAAVLGIQMSGAAYLPIDAGLPAERIRLLLDLGKVKRIVTTEGLLDGLGLDARFGTIEVTLDIGKDTGRIEKRERQKAEDLAYVIFTSGSTGEPKGVAIDHRGAVNTILDVNERFGITAEDKAYAISSLSFDLSVWDIFGILAVGGSVVVPGKDDNRNPEAWVRDVNMGVTVWNSVPALAKMLTEYAKSTGVRLGLKKIFMSGDWIPVGLPDEIRGLCEDPQMISMGGATEASIWSIYYAIGEVDRKWKSIPYGKPLGNQKMHILKKDMTDSPEWVTGDIYIEGTGLARCYWGDEEKTSKSFVNGGGRRLYRTGDIGRYCPDGNIEFLGRIDNQVKIRGFRIELGEIESALSSHEGIKEAVVVARSDADGVKYLCCFYTGEEEIGYEEFKEFLGKTLPDYMIPSYFHRLESIPLTSSGKLDRKSLPSIEGEVRSVKEYEAPRNETEEKLVKIWQEVLGVERIGINDNFFELGGHSLKAIKMINAVNTQFDVLVPVSFIFKFQNIKILSMSIISTRFDTKFEEVITL
jgi:amino acid adenylation domain-containing protein